MSNVSRVYIDTNVFAYKLVPHPNYSGHLLSKANNFFQDIVNRKYEGVTSTFTTLEYKGLIKKMLSEINGRHVTQLEEQTAMTDLTRFLHQLGIMLTDADLLSADNVGVTNLFSTSFAIVGSAVAVNTQNSKNPWKRENLKENRNFVFQVKMHPMLVEEFHNPVKLRYTNGMDVETGITTKSYMSGMVEITDTQYKIIAKKLVDSNLDQLI